MPTGSTTLARGTRRAASLLAVASLFAACVDPIASPGDPVFARKPGSDPGTPDPNSCYTSGTNGKSKNDKNQCTWSIGGTLSGLGTSTTLVLRLNNATDLSLTQNGTFTFSTGVAPGASYSVVVKTQPTGQTCTVTNGTGTANSTVTNLNVTCAAAGFTIGGTVTGLQAGKSVVLQNNLGDDLTVSANGSFTFTTLVATGSTYSVTVKTSPTGQGCFLKYSPTSPSGTVAGANVTNVAVECLISVVSVSNQLPAGQLAYHYIPGALGGPNSEFFGCNSDGESGMTVLSGRTNTLYACNLTTLAASYQLRIEAWYGTSYTDTWTAGPKITVESATADATCVQTSVDFLPAGGAWLCTFNTSSGSIPANMALTIKSATP